MRIKRILEEMPYLHPGEMPRKLLDKTISISAVHRDYRKFGLVDDVVVLLDKHDRCCIGLPENWSVTASQRIQPVFWLSFKRQHDLKFNHNLIGNVVQVDRVEVAEGRANQGLMSEVYKMLADKGFVLVSDNVQFEPAQALWKKIASDSGYVILIADVDHGFFKDRNGEIIQYNGKNIPDQDIWSSGSQDEGYYRVFVLTNKQ